jgi:diguanylate cyclase (GGDEF)-like protein
LDNFTEIRSKTGIKASDALLLQIAGLLRKIVKSQEVLARFGDHTFTILSQESDSQSAEKSAKKICAAIENNAQSDQQIQVTCSIGVVFCSEEFSTGNDFITHAYQACEVARSQGGNSYYIAEELIPAVDSEIAGEADLSALIRFAFDNDKFQLAYQPIVSLHGDT